MRNEYIYKMNNNILMPITFAFIIPHILYILYQYYVRVGLLEII